MQGDHVYYKAGYKYRLEQTYSVQTNILGYEACNPFLKISRDGVLTIKSGYAWDGASGPTVDTKTSIRGSLVHDALYQLERENLISLNERKNADKMLRDICIEDGMCSLRAKMWYRAVRLFGGPAADPNLNHPALVAP